LDKTSQKEEGREITRSSLSYFWVQGGGTRGKRKTNAQKPGGWGGIPGKGEKGNRKLQHLGEGQDKKKGPRAKNHQKTPRRKFQLGGGQKAQRTKAEAKKTSTKF